MPLLELRSISKSYGRNAVLSHIDLSIEPGEAIVLFGPSGSGKSTLLRIIAGIEARDEGTIMLEGKVIDDLAPHRRDLGLVLQSGGYYEQLTVRENLMTSLKAQGASKPDRLDRLNQVAGLLKIAPLLDRHCHQLSGGELQRTILGRILVRKPKLLLLDEPFNHLDPALRFELRSELEQWCRKFQATLLYVTHDASEAMQMADRIAVLLDGCIQQVGSPKDLYRQPNHPLVAKLLCSIPPSQIRARRTPHAFEYFLDGNAFELGAKARSVLENRLVSESHLPKSGKQPGTTTGYQFIVRPEHWKLLRPEPSLDLHLTIPVRLISKRFQGLHWLVHAETAAGQSFYALVDDAADAFTEGDACHLSVSTDQLLVFRDDALSHVI